MPGSNSGPGIAGIIAGLLVVSTIISVGTGDYSIWAPVLLAIFVSLKTVRRIRR